MTTRIGIIGAARIAPAAIIAPARAEGMNAEIVTVAARDRARAEAYAKEHAIPSVCDDYEHLFARDDIDLVYIATPPNVHAEQTLASLASGKHTLVEKPFAISTEEATRCTLVAEEMGVRLFEASHYHFHPTFERLLAAVQSGAIGRVTEIDAVFDTVVERNDWEFRWRPECKGGVLRDIGFYPLHLVRTVMAAEPSEVEVETRCDSADGVDAQMTARLAFPGGRSARISCDMRAGLTPKADAILTGEKGRITLSVFVQPMYGKLRIETPEGVEEIAGDRSATFVHQLRRVIDAIGSGAPLRNESADILGQARAFDKLYGAAPKVLTRC